MMWWNYVARKYDERQPETDDIAKQYLPQNDAVQNLYDLYRSLNMPILKSMLNVLHQSIGEAAPFPLDQQTTRYIEGNEQ